MIVQYIQSVEAQAISDEIHYTRMVNQYNQFIWNGDPNNMPENMATSERIQEIWGASKLFLACTKEEAIVQYNLIGLQNDVPVIPLQGITTAYAISKTIEGNNNCIPIPMDGLENYDLSEFTYKIIDIDFPEE